jgi:hypothetical protein
MSSISSFGPYSTQGIISNLSGSTPHSAKTQPKPYLGVSYADQLTVTNVLGASPVTYSYEMPIPKGTITEYGSASEVVSNLLSQTYGYGNVPAKVLSGFPSTEEVLFNVLA